MGAWGTGSFENDNARDWIQEFQRDPHLSAVEARLRDTADFPLSEYMEYPDCYGAVAAAEVVAALNGKPSPALPVELIGFLSSHHAMPAQSLLRVAIQALDRVLQPDNSEATDGWVSDADRAQWVTCIQDLRNRLT